MTPVDLAPGHKLGLALPNPVLLASGVIGYGDALPSGLALSQLGGFVTAPVTWRPWRGERPRLLEVSGGLLWQRGLWNPGLRRVVRDHAVIWRRSPVPVIVQAAGSDPGLLAAVAGGLEDLVGVAGLQIDLPDEPGPAAALVWAVREAADLPLLARLSLQVGDDVVRAALDAGADGLVLAQPPLGLWLEPGSGQTIRGDLYGPGLAAQVAARLANLAGWVQRPLVACGGIFGLADALTCLSAGAAAVQIDAAVWVDPGLPARLVAALAGGTAPT